MVRGWKIQVAAVLAGGALLGYLAASASVSSFSGAQASAPVVQATSPKPADPGSAARPACCCQEVDRGRLLGLADAEMKRSIGPGKWSSKKANNHPSARVR